MITFRVLQSRTLGTTSWLEYWSRWRLRKKKSSQYKEKKRFVKERSRQKNGRSRQKNGRSRQKKGRSRLKRKTEGLLKRLKRPEGRPKNLLRSSKINRS